MRYGLDILMLVLLVGEMAFFYLPPLVHEAVGVAFLLPIAWHLALNRRYVSSLGRGRWNGPHSVRLILNVLLMAACFMTIVSGCLTSSELFADVVPFSLRSNPSLYQLHSTAARYFLVLAGLHLGLHLKAWWQKWLHSAGITSRPLPARMLLSVQVLYFTYSCGSTTLPSLLTEKCRCGPTSPSAAAVEPTRPMMSPASTVLPCSTGGSCCRLLYCVS